jgi:hypothetical protein
MALDALCLAGALKAQILAEAIERRVNSAILGLHADQLVAIERDGFLQHGVGHSFSFQRGMYYACPLISFVYLLCQRASYLLWLVAAGEREVALRVDIGQEHAPAEARELHAKRQRGRGLPCAAFVQRDRQNSHRSLASWKPRRFSGSGGNEQRRREVSHLDPERRLNACSLRAILTYDTKRFHTNDLLQTGR